MNLDTTILPVEVPDGVSGDFRIESFSMSEQESLSTLMRASVTNDADIYAPAGAYKKLVQHSMIDGDVIVMSNTPMEYRSNKAFINQARGRVLINGLGLGMVLTAILKKPRVSEVWVIEQSEDVIKLVGPTFSNDPRVQIIHADALKYTPPTGTSFDCVWHDIWPFICTDNLSEMDMLEARYQEISKWQGSWCRDKCQKMSDEMMALRRHCD